MKKLLLYALCVPAGLLIAMAFRADTDPLEVLTKINATRAEKIKAARDAGQTVDIAALTREATEAAREAVKGVDPNFVEPAKGYSWAQLFQMAGQTKDACDAATRYLQSNPGPADKYRAQSLMIQCCNTLGEGHMVKMLVGQMQPPDVMAAATFAQSTARMYADTIMKTEGLNAALDALKTAESKLDYDALATYYKDAADKRAAANPAAAKVDPADQVDAVRAAIGQARAELYGEANKKADAVKALDATLALVKPTGTAARSLKAAKVKLTLVGAVAPEIAAERAHGTFEGLGKMRGKVVIVDFFAHWCGPCIASFPDVKKMYADLHDKGLEIVGFTTYYGYYKTENTKERDMPRDTEFEKMGQFIKDYELPWTVVLGERTNYDNYGVTAIPTTALIDREGKVHSLHVGYSKESFAAFRKEVERLLGL